jgi:hypothetical protein
VFITLAIDDSADQFRRIAMAAAAFAGDDGQWTRLCKAWNERLKEDGLKYFKASEYNSLTGEFYRFRDPVKYPKPLGGQAASKLRDDLDEISRQSNVTGMGMCIPLATYNDVRLNFPEADVYLPEDAFDAALQTLWREEAREFIKHFGYEHKLGFLCDQSSSSDRHNEHYIAFKANHPELAKIMGPIAFADDKDYPQLQAADLLVNMLRQEYEEFLKSGGLTAQTRFNSHIFTIRHWSRKNMEDMVSYNQIVRQK